MDFKTFIEEYCLIKDKNNDMHRIKLKDYQIKLIDYLKLLKKSSY